jgi:hypothetical protein
VATEGMRPSDGLDVLEQIPEDRDQFTKVGFA